MTCAGYAQELEIRVRRIPPQGCHVRASSHGKTPQRLVCFAHFDAKVGIMIYFAAGRDTAGERFDLIG